MTYLIIAPFALLYVGYTAFGLFWCFQGGHQKANADGTPISLFMRLSCWHAIGVVAFIILVGLIGVSTAMAFWFYQFLGGVGQ